MKKVALVIDSSFGITSGHYPDVHVLPLIINETKNGITKTYHDGVNINAKTLVKKLQQGIDIKTSQSIPIEIHNMLKKIHTQYERVYVFPIPISISSGANTWKMLAKEFDNVTVFDQQMVTLPAQWTIVDFVNHIKKHKDLSIDDVEKYLNNIYTKRIGFVVVPDAKFLVKGGRVSNFKGMIIKLFNLKLVITLYNDGLKFFDKTSSVDGIVKILPKCFSKKTGMKFSVNNIKHFSLFYSKTDQPKFKVQEIVDEIKKTYPSIKIVNEELPAIIAAHTGSDYVVVVCEFK